MTTPDSTPASADSVMAKAMMLVGALDDSCEEATSLPFLEAVTALRAEVERLAAQAARDDAALYQTIGERDNYHKWADKLADGIATHLGIDIGEHTAGMGSAESNNPWANALEAIQSADPPACPNCRGSGCVQQMTGHLGPDDYEETVDCPHCNGNQTLGAAYEGVLKSLRDEREAHTRTRSIIWGWTSSRSEVNAVQHKLGNILEHLKPGNIAWVGDRLRDLIASAAAQPSQAPVVQAVQAREYPPLPWGNQQPYVWFCRTKDTDLVAAFRAYVDADRASSGATTQAVRMLTEDEQAAIIDMHSTGRAQGDHECAEAIQRKFCEVNKLPAPADGVIGGA